MDSPYIHQLAKPAFTEFVKAEQACDIAWANVKEARTLADRKIALENYREIQSDSRLARSLYHKCDMAVRYDPEYTQQQEEQ